MVCGMCRTLGLPVEDLQLTPTYSVPTSAPRHGQVMLQHMRMHDTLGRRPVLGDGADIMQLRLKKLIAWAELVPKR